MSGIIQDGKDFLPSATTEDACEHDMLMQIRWQGGSWHVPLSQLKAINPDESSNEAIGDWHYWAAQGYCL